MTHVIATDGDSDALARALAPRLRRIPGHHGATAATGARGDRPRPIGTQALHASIAIRHGGTA